MLLPGATLGRKGREALVGQSAPKDPLVTPLGNGCGHSGQQVASSFLGLTCPRYQPETDLLGDLQMKILVSPLLSAAFPETLGKWAGRVR